MLSSSCNDGILAGLGFGSLADLEEREIVESMMRSLYEYCRQSTATERFPSDDPTFKADWIDLSNPKAYDLVFGCAGVDDDTSLKRPKQFIKQELEARDWNRVLGIVEPTILCAVRIHGQKWGIRFQTASMYKGKELRNRQLPPVAKPSESEPKTPPTETDGGSYMEEYLK